MAAGQPQVVPDSLQQVPWPQRGFFLGAFCFAPYMQAGPGAGGTLPVAPGWAGCLPWGLQGLCHEKAYPSFCLSIRLPGRRHTAMISTQVLKGNGQGMQASHGQHMGKCRLSGTLVSGAQVSAGRGNASSRRTDPTMF